MTEITKSTSAIQSNTVCDVIMFNVGFPLTQSRSKERDQNLHKYYEYTQRHTSSVHVLWDTQTNVVSNKATD